MVKFKQKKQHRTLCHSEGPNNNWILIKNNDEEPSQSQLNIFQINNNKTVFDLPNFKY